jgi:hypothetical protein
MRLNLINFGALRNTYTPQTIKHFQDVEKNSSLKPEIFPDKYS